ncbi:MULTISPECIES: dipeptide/oligopeptide/nickel ABC transporter permease/ATP-binding protein [Micrococcaceae]|uniref:dipeptide/oligopeptide/nickel ABC transporter permease/ATP-binding protein n=1 Tax=Micrococcaceae TaxID=1268 RepID=UPI001CFF7DA5|nr:MULTISPECIES: dipeptide/oligopeptide/nickel ABC transporter permease/ATP-binding protein [Micrococcaceae]MCB5283706.1 Oligopeptide transport ATP-binding protein OppD [Arthrobacter sp. ES1]MDJ0354021.1 dipeptide/oligopeptide/nickel ABC transporter permease/ATP-binding protein [Pseudarthrobacter sp. PH31-O2]WGZ80881.1 dipeptide/oligopeptide/nickel ABC transporter permease/ATP-binding protein [Arthrobacter sp. EM1]
MSQVTLVPAAAGQTFRRTKRFLRNPLGVAAAMILLIIVLVSVLAPWISPRDPNLISLGETLLGPSPAHPLGTDASGRDVLSRLFWGGQVSLQAGLIMTVTTIVCGVPTGLLAGYFSKWFDGVASWASNLLMSLPQILILLMIVTSLGTGLWPTMIALGILCSPDLFRVTRSVVIGVRGELFIDAAKVSGLGNARIIFRHVLSVVLGPVLIRSSFIFGLAIIVQSGLEFLGIGGSDRPSWGGMLSSAFTTIFRAPQLIYPPGIAIGFTVMSLVILGGAFADTLGSQRPMRAARPKAGDRPVPEPAVAVNTRRDSAPITPVDALLRVENLRIAYPRHDASDSVVVKGISLYVNKGEVVGLVGESGSGKSQTSFGVLGLLPPESLVSADLISLNGQNLLGLPESELQRVRGTRMAYVPQEPMSNLDPSFTVAVQLVKPMRHKLGISRAEATARAHALLERVGIPDPARTMASYPHQLSGGMAQRVLIAGAVSCDPELLIADEPTTALDVTVQADVLNLLRDLQRERNMGMILVTHNFGVVADICDRVAVMRDGVIVEQQDATKLFGAPKHEYTKMLLAATLEGAEPRKSRSKTEAAR